MKKPKRLEFKKGEQLEFNTFLRNHFVNVQRCGDLTHFVMREMRCAKNVRRDYAMTIKVDYTYMEYELTYDEQWAIQHYQAKNYEEMLRTICHEATHMLTLEPVSNLKIKGESDYYFERLTEQASRWLYAKYLYYMKENGIDVKTGTTTK